MQDQPSEPSGGGTHRERERLRWLADLYGTQPTLDSVALAIVERSRGGALGVGDNELPALRDVVSLIIRDDAGFEALMSGREISLGLREKMVRAVAPYVPAMPSETFVERVLENLQIAAIPARGEPGDDT